MKLFETERLIIKGLRKEDKVYFTELLSHPDIIEPIPQKPYTQSQIDESFNKSLNLDLGVLNNEKRACGIFEKGNPEMIGLALFLINDENDKELGYRFRKKYWGKGYGTETTKGMIDFYFQILNIEKIIADVNTENTASVKILSKFLKPTKEFFNESDNCTDRRYELYKNDWLEKRV